MNVHLVLDDQDQAIIDLLRRDGRISNQELAEQLGLTASTVSIRIRRMELANKLRVVAVSDFSAHGLGILMPLAIEVHGRSPHDVARELAAFPEIFALHLVSGPHAIDALLAVKSHDEAAAFFREKFSTIRGIRAMDLAIAVDVLKYKFDVVPIDELGAQA